MRNKFKMNFVLFLGLLLTLSSCTKVNSFDLSSEFSSYFAGQITSDNMSVDVHMNNTKDFNVLYTQNSSTGVTDVKLSFSKDSRDESTGTTPVLGKVSILSQENMELRYEPPFNFKGRDSIYAYIHHRVNGKPAISKFEIAFVVTNPNPESMVFINTLTVTVNKNSVDNPFVVATPVGDKREPEFSLSNVISLLTITTQQNGSVTILDKNLGTFKYTPANMFTGVDNVTAYFKHLVEGVETVSQFSINFLVINPNPDAAMISGDLAIETIFGTPKAFGLTISNSSPTRHPSISFHATNPSINTTNTASGGTVAVTDNDNGLMLYTPSIGFRGTESVTVYLHQTVEGIPVITNFKITFIVKNPTLTSRPALAIRATECAMCHAQIKGNLITDGGYGVDTIGQALGFGYRWSDNGVTAGSFVSVGLNGTTANSPHNFYGLTTLLTGYPGYPRASITNGGVVVPNVNVPVGQFGLSGVKTLPQMMSDNTPYTVTSKSTVYIGVPSAASYLSFLEAPAKYRYIKEDANTSWDLAGLTNSVISGVTVFKNDPNTVFVCEGDLIIDGTLLLRNLTIESDTGCRLYVSGTVILQGPISYPHKSRRTNIQITTPRAALIGIGQCPEGDYISRNSYAVSYGGWIRSAPSVDAMTAHMNTVAAEYSAAGPHPNFGCSGSGVESRNVSYESLLINAPWVSSRYTANFKGAVIAEVAFMSLGNFYFEYDPVFDSAAVFPLVPTSSYLVVDP